MDEYKFVALKQRHVEAWSNALPDPKETKPIAYNGAMVREAFRAGWFETQLTDEQVNDLSPALVASLAAKIAAEFSRVMEIPKN